MADDQHSSIERARLANLAYIANGKNRAEQGQPVTRVRISWLRDFLSEIEKLKLLPPLSLEMLIPQPQQEKEEVPEEIEVPTSDLESAMKILPHYLQAHFKKYQNMTERANSGLDSATDDSITAMIVENKLKFQRQNMEGRLPNLFTSAENDSVAAAGRNFLIMDFDKRVKAALAIQAAFRRFKLRCDDTVWPSEERLGSAAPRARDAKARYMLSAADIAKENARVKALHEQEIKELEASRLLREAEEQLHKLGESKPQTRSGTPNNAAFTSAGSHPSSSLLVPHGGDESTAAGLGGTISAWDGSSHSALPFTATTSLLLGATVSSSPALYLSLETDSRAGAITAVDGILGMSHISGKDNASHAKALSNSGGDSASSAPLPGSGGAADTPASGGEVDIIYTSVEASNGAPLQSVGVEESDVQSLEEEEEEEAGPVWKVSGVKVIETSEVVVKTSAEEIAEAEAREAAAAAEAAARAAAEEAKRLEQEQLDQERLMREKLAEEASAAEAMQKAALVAAAKQRLREARKAQRQAEKAAARAARTASARAAGLKEGVDEEEQEDEDYEEEKEEEQEVVTELTELMENSQQDTFAAADKDTEAPNKGPQGEGGSKMNPVEWVPRYEVPASGTRAATPPQPTLPTPASTLLNGRLMAGGGTPVLQSAQNAVRHQDAGSARAEQVTAVHAAAATQQQMSEGRMAKRKAEKVAAARAAAVSGNGLGQEEEGDFEDQQNEGMEEEEEGEEVGEDEDDDEHRSFPPHVSSESSESSARLNSAQVSHTRSVTSAQQVDPHNPSSPSKESPQKVTPTANALVSSTHAAGSSYQGPSSATEPAMNVAEVSSAASVHKSAAADLLVSATGSAVNALGPHLSSVESNVDNPTTLSATIGGPSEQAGNRTSIAAAEEDGAILAILTSHPHPRAKDHVVMGTASPSSSAALRQHFNTEVPSSFAAPMLGRELPVGLLGISSADLHSSPQSSVTEQVSEVHADLSKAPPAISEVSVMEKEVNVKDVVEEHRAHSDDGALQRTAGAPLQHPTPSVALHEPDYMSSDSRRDLIPADSCGNHQQGGDVIEQLRHAADPLTVGTYIQQDPESRHEEEQADEECFVEATTQGPLHDVVQDAQHAVQAEVFVEVNIHATHNADEPSNGGNEISLVGLDEGGGVRSGAVSKGNSDYPNQQQEGDVRHVTEEDLKESAADGGRRGREVLVDDAGGDHNADEAVDEAEGDGDTVMSVVDEDHADVADDQLEDESGHWIRGPTGDQDTTGVADTCVAEEEDVIRRDGQNLDAAAEGVGRVPEHNALEDDLVLGSAGYGDHVQHDQQNGFQHSKGGESDEFGYQGNEEQRYVEGNGRDHDEDTEQNSGDQLDDHADDGVDFVGGEDNEQGTSVYEEDAKSVGGGVEQSQGDMDQAMQDEVMSGNTSSTHDDGVKVVRRKPSISVKITAPAVLEGDGTVEAGSYHTSVNDDGGGPASARVAPAIPHPPDMPSPLFFSPRHSLSNTAQHFSLSRQYTDTQQPSAMTGPGLRAVHQMGERRLSQPLHGPSILPPGPASASTSPTRLRTMAASGDDLDYPAGIMSPSHTSVGSTKRLGVVAAGAASTTSPRSVLRKQEAAAAAAAAVPGAAARPALVPAEQHGSIIGMSLNSNAMHHNGVAHLEMPMADPNAWSAWRTLQRSAYIMQELAYVGDHAETFRPGLRFVPEMDTMYHLSNAAAAAKKAGIKQTGSNIIQTTSSLSLPSIQRGINSHMPHFSRPLYGGTTTGAALLYGSPRRVKMALSPNGRFRSLMPFPGAEGPGGRGEAAGVRSRSNNVDAAWNQMGAAKLPLLVSGRSQSLGGMMD